MNGRIYDPLLGRMLSADIMVEFPGSLQSYNRYSYVRNNPLTATDTSGFAENTYATMTDAATDMVSRGNNVGAFFTVLGQQAFQMVSLGTFSSNSAVAGQVGINQMSVGEGAARMGANTAIAATAATAAVVTGGASAAVVGGSGLAAGVVGGAVGGFAAGAVQTGGDTAVAAATGGRVPTVGENAKQIAASTAVGAAGGALVGGAAAVENRLASATPKTAAVSEVNETAPANVTTPVGELRAAGKKDAHHVIQDAAVRDVPGYNAQAAPGVQLAGPSTAVGTPHYAATQVQRQAGGGTYGAERRIAYKALREGGMSPQEARKAIGEADAHFKQLGVTRDTPTRVPGNRKKPDEP